MADNQIENLRIMFANMSVDMEAGANALELLSNQDVFTHDQRNTLRQLIQASATTECVHASNGSKRQTHIYVYNYGTEKLWTGLLDKSTRDDEACNLWADLFHMIGLRFPDVDTTKVVVATTLAARNEPANARVAFQMHAKLRAINVKRRQSRKDQPLILTKFPENVNEFLHFSRTSMVKARLSITESMSN